MALLWSGIALAQMGQTTPYNPYGSYPGQMASPYTPYPAQPDMTAKNPLLLALVVQPLLQQSGGAVASGVGRLFTRLFDALLGRTGGAATVPAPSMPGAPGYVAGMPTTYGQPPPYGTTYPGTTYPSGMPGATSGYPPGTMGASPYPGTSPPAYGMQAPGVNPMGPASPYGNTPPGTYPAGMTPGYPAAGTTAYATPPGSTTMPPGTSPVTTMPGAQASMTASVPGSYMPGAATMPPSNPSGMPAGAASLPSGASSGTMPTATLPTSGIPNTMMPSSPSMMPSGAMPTVPSPGGTAPSTSTMAGTSMYSPGTAGAVQQTGTVPGMPPAGPMPAGNKAVLLPSVVYSLDELDPKKFSTKRHIKISAGAVPKLHTGDVFAIEYSTNLPGQLRIDNIDSAGTLAELGTYVMLPGRDNRIPITKGIKLVGETGTETFKMYFFPCVPEGDAAGAAEGLPTCPTGPSPQLLQASRHHVGAKGAVNLDSPDPTIAVAAVTDYQPNDVMVNEFRIDHIALAASSNVH